MCAAETTFGHDPRDFNLLTGDLTIYLGMAVVIVIIATAILDVVGLTLRKVPSGQQAAQSTVYRPARHDRYEMPRFQRLHTLVLESRGIEQVAWFWF